MHQSFLELLRCPFCGVKLSIVENDALVRVGEQIQSGVLGCECCAFPVIAGIPVMIADDVTREAMHALEAGHAEQALHQILGLDAARGRAFNEVRSRGNAATYRALLEILSLDAEGTYFVYRFSDPTFVMCDALVRALGQDPRVASGRVLDLCGGSGHLTRSILQHAPAGGTVLADVYFWKLWLAAEFTAREATAVCCDANQPLPFARDTFSLVVLSDAFPYIWHKRLLADEMIRLTGSDGVVAMPHLHSALGENFSAGDTLSPAAYQQLFDALGARVFSDESLFSQVVADGLVDLTRHITPEALGHESSLTLVASPRASVFRKYDVRERPDVAGELRVNPLYEIGRKDGVSVLTLTFPTPEYEEEFGECRTYLPDSLTIDTDLTGRITREMLGARYDELRRRRIILDVPVGYL